MADNYGVTFAQKLLQHGDYQQAVEAASKHAEQDPSNPEPYHDRARAQALLGCHEEAVADYARALEIDKEAQVLQDWEVDDGLFSTLLAWAQASPEVERQLQILRRYAELIPGGRHLREAEEWSLRFRGLLKTTFVKPRD
jgi:tetratricopeptide (TPR) repeat protein